VTGAVIERNQIGTFNLTIYTNGVRQPSVQLDALSQETIDKTRIEASLVVTSISYGEGAQRQVIPRNRLHVLPPSIKLRDDNNEPISLVDLFFKVTTGPSPTDKKMFVPHAVVVKGKKPESFEHVPVLVHVCTDVPYVEQQANEQKDGSFEAPCLIGMGGIVPFVDDYGNLRPRGPLDVGDGIGCVAAIVAVAYSGGRPFRRSRYVLVARKGIRYPDDIWCSIKSGRPICSKEGDISNARFIFQSPEPNGSSCDVFVANYNGGNMCNLNSGEPSAWDGFYAENGEEVACWTSDGQIQYCTRSTGIGKGTLVSRPDCAKSTQ